MPSALLVDAADAAAIAEAATERSDYGRYYEEYDDDEEVEAFYFSAAAGRARITLGNRRFGNNGYIAAGRMQARPLPRVNLSTLSLLLPSLQYFCCLLSTALRKVWQGASGTRVRRPWHRYST